MDTRIIDSLLFHVSTPDRGYFVTVKVSEPASWKVSSFGIGSGPASPAYLHINGDPAVSGVVATVEFIRDGSMFMLRRVGEQNVDRAVAKIIYPGPGIHGGNDFTVGAVLTVGRSTVRFLEALAPGEPAPQYEEEIRFLVDQGMNQRVEAVTCRPGNSIIRIGSDGATPERPALSITHSAMRLRHAVLERQGDGRLMIIDLGSGTEVWDEGGWREVNKFHVTEGSRMRFGHEVEVEIRDRRPVRTGSPQPRAASKGAPAPAPNVKPSDPGPVRPTSERVEEPPHHPPRHPATPTPGPDTLRGALVKAGRRGVAQLVRWAREVEKAER